MSYIIFKRSLCQIEHKRTSRICKNLHIIRIKRTDVRSHGAARVHLASIKSTFIINAGRCLMSGRTCSLMILKHEEYRAGGIEEAIRPRSHLIVKVIGRGEFFYDVVMYSQRCATLRGATIPLVFIIHNLFSRIRTDPLPRFLFFSREQYPVSIKLNFSTAFLFYT